MLSPIAIATWIAFCIPWAEPRLAASLISAGSEGEPYLVTDGSGKSFVGKSPADGIRYMRQQAAESKAQSTPDTPPLYIGLMQIPSFALKQLGVDPEVAMDKCSNLEIGYTLFVAAHNHAGSVEKSPWKTLSVAYAYFRDRQNLIDTPYAKKATDYLMKAAIVAPAGMNDPIYHSVAAEWSAGLASRHSMRNGEPGKSLLVTSDDLTKWARMKY